MAGVGKDFVQRLIQAHWNFILPHGNTSYHLYTRDGKPLKDILLYDQDGRPIVPDTTAIVVDVPKGPDGLPIPNAYLSFGACTFPVRPSKGGPNLVAARNHGQVGSLHRNAAVHGRRTEPDSPSSSVGSYRVRCSSASSFVSVFRSVFRNLACRRHRALKSSSASGNAECEIGPF